MLSEPVDLLVRNARLVATMSDAGELADGWVAISGGLVVGTGSSADAAPAASKCQQGGTCATRL